VFFSEEVLVDSPVERTRQVLTTWLALEDSSSAASQAAADGGAVLVRAGFAGLTKTVQVRAMPLHVRGDVTVVPLRWSPTGPAGDLYPTLDANLEITAVDPTHTLIALVGSYRPPIGRVGAALDQAVLRHAARVTIRRWLDQVGAAATASPTHDGSEGPPKG
jgi:hypothetical protein